MKVWEFDSTIDCLTDFKKKYRNTFVLLHHSKMLAPETPGGSVMRIMDCLDDGSICGRLGSSRQAVTIGVDDPHCSISNIVPKKGYFYSDKYGVSVFVQRKPSRQWMKGLCSSNTSMVTGDGVFTNQTWHPDEWLATEYLNQERMMYSGVPFQEAVERIKEGRKSFPLNRKFCLALSWSRKHAFTLLYNTIPVASVTPDLSVNFFDTGTMVMQEFKDYLRRTYSHEVEVHANHQ